MSVRIFRLAILLVVLSSGAEASLLFEQQAWFPDGWNNRIFLYVPWKEGSKEAFIDFYSGGMCKKDGSDILMIDAYGKTVPREITSIGPGDRFLVTFPLTSAAKYILYYNNPEASQPVSEYRRQGGLLLEIFNLSGEECRDVRQLETIAEKSRTLTGSGYRRRIFDGFNPYGYSDNFLAVYSGWIDVPESGLYFFATNSNDSSFLFVDGKLVVSFPGKHPAWAIRGQRNGRISLKKGLHQITYYHVEFTGPQAAVAGWKKPGAKTYEVIPHNSFLPISKAQTIRREAKGIDFYDFTFDYGDVLYLEGYEGNPIIEMTFQPYIPANKKIKLIYWDFGDGQLVNDDSPWRLFLQTGLCTVKMSLLDTKGITHTMTHVVPVYPIEINNSKNPALTSERFAHILETYNMHTLDRQELLTLFHFYVLQENNAFVENIGTRLMSIIPDNENEIKLRFLRRFAEYLEQIPVTTASLREKVYKNIILLCKKDKEAEYAWLGLADSYYEQGKIDKAAEFYRLCVKSKQPFRKREALVGLGKISIEKNNRNDAITYFHDASKTAAENNINQELAKLNAFAIENYIAKEEWQQALVILKEWEISEPYAYLSGNTNILRIRAFLKAGDMNSAVRYAKVIADNLEPNPYTPESYSVLITLLMKTRRFEEATSYLNRLKDEYPDSRFLRELELKKDTLSLLHFGKDE